MPSSAPIPGMSYEVMQRIKRERQLGLDDRDSTYRPLQIVSGYNPRVFIADVEPSDLLPEERLTVQRSFYGETRER